MQNKSLFFLEARIPALIRGDAKPIGSNPTPFSDQ